MELRHDADELLFGTLLAEVFEESCIGTTVESPAEAINRFIRAIEEDERRTDGDGTWLVVLLTPGLKVVASDGREISSSCCCGLSDWRDWLFVPNGTGGPWLGHDPSPGVGLDGESILVWSDYESDARVSPFGIRMPVERYLSEFDRVQPELELFSHRVSRWVVDHSDEETAERIARRLDRDLNITSDHRPPSARNYWGQAQKRGAERRPS